jgi:hypothetical protein
VPDCGARSRAKAAAASPRAIDDEVLARFDRVLELLLRIRCAPADALNPQLAAEIDTEPHALPKEHEENARTLPSEEEIMR